MSEHRMLIGVVVGTALLAFAGCGGRGNTTTSPPESHRIQGTFTLNGTLDEDFIDLDADSFDDSSDDYGYPEGHNCAGTGGYNDVQAGLQVTVKNQDGTVIGTGKFGSGTITVDGPCEFHFAIPNVPKATFYQIEAGRRGTLRFSNAQMQGNNWKVDFTLG